MSWTYFTYIKENVLEEDMQKIINDFPVDWFYWGESKRDKKPIRQSWGWSTIVDVGNPWTNYKDDDLGIICIVTVSGSFGIVSDSIGKEISDFIVCKLKEFGYTILKTNFSY